MKLSGPKASAHCLNNGNGFGNGTDYGNGFGSGYGYGLNLGEGWGDGNNVSDGQGDGGFDLGSIETVYARAPVAMSTRSFDGHLINMFLRGV